MSSLDNMLILIYWLAMDSVVFIGLKPNGQIQKLLRRACAISNFSENYMICRLIFDFQKKYSHHRLNFSRDKGSCLTSKVAMGPQTSLAKGVGLAGF